MKLGVFLCSCNDTINIDFRNVKKRLKNDRAVEVVEIHPQLCQAGLDYIIDDIRRFELDGIVIAACTTKNRIFESATTNFGCDALSLNIREHCGWVHGKREATEKAKSMINAAINYVTIKRSLPVPKKIVLHVGHDVLVIEDGNRGAIEVARSLSSLANVHLVTKNVQNWSDAIAIHVGEVKEISGSIGEFEVEIERDIDTEKCISCGLCVDACPKKLMTCGVVCTIEAGCDECGDCIDKCPTGAIKFHNREIIHAGQVLVLSEEWTGATQLGIYTAEDPAEAMGKVLAIVSNLGETEKLRFLDLNLERCLSSKSELIGCEFCLPCPYDAIRREGEKVVFDEVGCQGCGLCTSLCPLSVPQLQEYPNHLVYSQIETLLTGDLDKKIILFAATAHFETLNVIGREKLLYPPVLPLFVPCIDMVSETHILSAFEHGADGAILWGGEDCHIERVNTTVKFANMTLSAFDLGERVLLMSDAQLDAEAYTKIIADFVTGLKPSPIRNTKPVAIDFDKPKREVLLDLIHAFYMKTKVCPSLKEADTQFPFADVSISSKCTVCNACVNICLTNALIKDADKINFVYGNCIACGLCERACPEGAIALERVLDFSRLVEDEGRTLVESEFIACAGCGKLFMSKAAFERISELLLENEGEDKVVGEGELSIDEKIELLRYCEDCRASKAVEWTYRKMGVEGVG
ncbi:Heterodisulfide reductase subunit A-like protein [ANME-1 cluster archaeon GoMg2]|nr:Heterodisulfide reductase subunit A-like protein [ANME-1 cluster archaeon GoMg2]